MAYTRPWPIPPRNGTTIHHVTDSHVGYTDPYFGAGWDQAKLNLVTADVESVFVRHVDGMVLTGDITDDGGGPATNERTQDSRALDWLGPVGEGKPSVWVPGNHDFWDRETDLGGNPPYSAAAWEHVYGRPANSVTDIGDVRVLGFAPDKMERGDGWVISASTLTWLDNQCASTSRPVVLAVHYPLAEMNLQNGHDSAGSHTGPGTEMQDLIDSHANVVGLLSGHRHMSTTDVRSVDVLTVGSRRIVHLCGPSLAMTSSQGPNVGGYARKAKVPQLSLYVTIADPTRWEVRYRTHTPPKWVGVDGWRVTVADSAAGTVTHTQGGS